MMMWVVTAMPVKVNAQGALAGDANGDCKVDGVDFVVVFNNYGKPTSGGATQGDFNTDGKVNGVDFVILFNHYGQVCQGTPVPTPTPTPTPTPGGPTPTLPPIVTGPGIWTSAQELAGLPMSGAAWNTLVSNASQNTTPNLMNQDDKTDTNTVAKALVYARTRDGNYRAQVLGTLKTLVNNHPIPPSGQSTSWDSLAVLRSIGSYAISADLIDLPNYDSSFYRNSFRPWLSAIRSTIVEGGRGSLISFQEKRPNNWGSHGSASRIAADLYLNDTTDLNRAIQVYKGHLGDRASYSAFVYGSDLTWHCNSSTLYSINPKGCTKNGQNLDGARPDDQRRCGSFIWPPCKTNYSWEGFQGLIVSAEMLYRRGYSSYEWMDRALLRASEWLYNTTFSDGSKYPAEGDDRWIVWILNKRYGTNYSKTSGVEPGKMIGYTDWTHQ